MIKFVSLQSNGVMGYKSSKTLNYSLRAMAGLSTALGVGFIIWAVIVQNPPKTALTMYVCVYISGAMYGTYPSIDVCEIMCSGMVILGTLALCVGLLGLLISFMGRACLAILLLCSFLVAIGELALTISLVVDMDKSVNALVDYTLDSYKDAAQDALGDVEPKRRSLFEVKTREELEAEFTNDLQYARYIFLVLSIIEFILVIITTVVKIKHPYKGGVEGDEEDQLAAQSAMAQIQLEGLKNSVKTSNENGSESSTYTASKKMYKR